MNDTEEKKRDMTGEGGAHPGERVWLLASIAVLVLLFAAAFAVGGRLFGEEFAALLRWWGVLLLLGVGFYPLTNLVFSGFRDGGWLFSKVIGVALGAWTMWFCSSVHLLRFTQRNCLLVTLVLIALNLVLFVMTRKHRAVAAWKASVCAGAEPSPGKRIRLILLFELIFLVVFIGGCYIKCYRPEAFGTEKCMDYAFMTSMMRSDYMPPEDMWCSGTSLNYYYMGQFIATFLTRLSGVTVNVGYNLDLMMLAAFCFSLSYCVVYEVMRLTMELREKKKRQAASVGTSDRRTKGWAGLLLAHGAGALAGAAVTFAGNMHYTLFSKWIPAVQGMLGLTESSYWFPNSTRYIGYNPETNDKTIHEFPSYSFVLGDLHAHVTNLMFVLTVIGLLFAWLLYRRNRMEAAKEGGGEENFPWLREIFHPAIVLDGFFIGLFHMTNYWDFPIYYVVSGAIILFSNCVVFRFRKDAAKLTALHGVLVLVIAELTALLFTVRFDAMASGIRLCVSHTPLYQLIILWGLPIALLLGYFFALLGEQKRVAREERGVKSDKKRGKTEKSGNKLPALAAFLDRLELTDLFVLTLGLCAAGLVLLPELVYVKDIYSGDYKRANTMFKLTYQAFVMFGLMMGYVVPRFVFLKKNMRQLVGGLVGGYLLCVTFGYLPTSVAAWFGDVKDPSRFQGLDAAAYLESGTVSGTEDIRGDAEVVAWLNEHVSGRPVVLEANGDSYTSYNRISVLTGLPTLLGWSTHEWLWKDTYSVVADRSEVVQTIYTSTDREQVLQLVDAYEIEYIYVGGLERKKYVETGVNDGLLRSLGSVVFENDAGYLVQVMKP